MPFNIPVIGSVEVLAPLRDRFNQSHYALYQFYYSCNGNKYLSSLITIPKISQTPFDFLSNGAPTKAPRNVQPDQEDADMARAKELSRQMEEERIAAQLQADRERQDRERQQSLENEERQRQNELQRQQSDLQRQMEMQQRQEQQRQAEEERQRHAFSQQQANQMQHMESQMLQQRFMELSRGYRCYLIGRGGEY
jgi:type IV secretory pathway VirB10-like protein